MSVKMTFLRNVKYRGEVHPANTPFMVKDADVDELRKLGGFVLAEDAVAAEAKHSPTGVVKEAPVEVPPTKKRKRG